MSTDHPHEPIITPQRREEILLSFKKQGLMTTLGANVQEVQWGYVSLEMPYSPKITQQHGLVHGGVIGALADSACGYAALSIVKPGYAGLTAEYKINLLNPADGEKLIAIGKVLKPGNRLIVCQGDVYIEKAGNKKHCATMLMSLCVVENLNNL